MSDKNCFFSPSSLSKNSFVTMAMKGFLYANKEKIIQFFGIMDKKEAVLFHKTSSGQKGGCIFYNIWQ